MINKPQKHIMTADFVNFIPNIQSINPEKLTGFVLFCGDSGRADTICRQLRQDFHQLSITDVDNNGFHYVIPLEILDEKTLSDFIRIGLDWDKNQKFIQYTITFYDADAVTKMYNMLVARGYNVVILPNNMQLVIKCLDNSLRNDVFIGLKREVVAFEKAFPQSMDDYFNKILFSGKIEKTEYRKTIKQEFNLDEIQKDKDIIVRGILYQYFNKKIRAHLARITFPRKFDANKLDDKLKQNINQIRDFLYSVAEQYIDTQISNAVKTKHNVIVRFDYLKSCNEYNNFSGTLKQAHQWHKNKISLAKNRAKFYRESERGAYKIMDLNDGYYAVQLFTPQSLDFESQCMSHCVGEGFWDDLVHEEYCQIYSVRDATGFPHLTIEVNYGQIVQCRGYKNTIPKDEKLRTAVRTLMRAEKLDIPNINGWNPAIAYFKQNDQLYDVFNLPENFEINSYLDLHGMKLTKLPDMHTVTIRGSFYCSGNELQNLKGAPRTIIRDVSFSANPLTSLYGMPRNIYGKIYLRDTRLNAKSFVPIYMENKLDDIVGIDDKVIESWKQQIKTRKNAIANIMALLSDPRKK